MRERNKRSVKNSRLVNDVGNKRFEWDGRLHLQEPSSEVNRCWQNAFDDRRHSTYDSLRYDSKFCSLSKREPWIATQTDSSEIMREQAWQDLQHNPGKELLSGCWI